MTADGLSPGTLAGILALPGPLSEKLEAYSDLLRVEDPPYAAEYEALIERLRAGRIGETAPDVGDPMPPFLLPDQDGRFVAMDELLADGPLVVSFNRGHWCPYCQIELDALAGAAEEARALGARIVSIMPDRAGYTAPLVRANGGRVPILSDIGSGYALEIGLVLFVGDAIRDLMVGEGIHIGEVQGNDACFMPLPATFVVARDGRVAARHVDPDFRTRMEVDSILAALARLRGGEPGRS